MPTQPSAETQATIDELLEKIGNDKAQLTFTLFHLEMANFANLVRSGAPNDRLIDYTSVFYNHSRFLHCLSFLEALMLDMKDGRNPKAVIAYALLRTIEKEAEQSRLLTNLREALDADYPELSTKESSDGK